MRASLTRIGVAVFLLWGLAGASGAEDGRARLDAFMSDMVSLKAQFTQTVYDEEFQELESSRGVVYLQRPGRFRWNYTVPYPQEIVSDGERVWIYDSELAQVTVKRLNLALGQTPALLLTTEGSLEESFSVVELGPRKGLEWIELRPKRGDATFKRMRLGLGPRELRVMELVDSFGQTTELRFSAIEKNPRLDAALFTFNPPPGADIIGSDDEE